jgi:hypothetical protein
MDITTENLENNCSFKTGDMYIVGRYLIFMFDKWYPWGGVNDLIGSANTKEEIRNIIITQCETSTSRTEMVNIIDTKNGEIIALRVYESDVEEDIEDSCFYDEDIVDKDDNLNIDKLNELLLKIKE